MAVGPRMSEPGESGRALVKPAGLGSDVTSGNDALPQRGTSDLRLLIGGNRDRQHSGAAAALQVEAEINIPFPMLFCN
jgi:hypothetical protein